MIALRSWTRRWNRLVGTFGVIAMLFGLGMEVHAVIMVSHDAHGHGVAAGVSVLSHPFPGPFPGPFLWRWFELHMLLGDDVPTFGIRVAPGPVRTSKPL
jgi:hypothetical protein